MKDSIASHVDVLILGSGLAGQSLALRLADTRKVALVTKKSLDDSASSWAQGGIAAVLDPADSAMIKGFLINKFRGDPGLFDDGYRMIADRTGWPGFGVLPYFPNAWRLPAEDALDIASSPATGGMKIACLTLSRIANFDDLDPLKAEPGLEVVMVRAGEVLPADAALVILPGSKSTRGDLAYLRAQGWDIDLLAHHRRGGRILGICGGYQMLGTLIADPDGIEGAAGETAGLGLLDVTTRMTADKRLTRTDAVHVATGKPMSAYEIHIGRSDGADCARPFARIDGRGEGATSADGRVMGSYLHGMFSDDGFRAAFLRDLGVDAAPRSHAAAIEATLNQLAAHLEAHLDVAGLLALAR